MAGKRGTNRQGMPGSGPQAMGNVLSALLSRRGYASLGAAEELEQAWREAAGPLAEHALPGRLQRGRLEVVVRSSAVLQELTFQKSAILRRLTERLPEQTIQDLKLRVGTLE